MPIGRLRCHSWVLQEINRAALCSEVRGRILNYYGYDISEDIRHGFKYRVLLTNLIFWLLLKCCLPIGGCKNAFWV